MRVDKRFFSLFLVVLLAVSVFAPFISAQENDYAMLSVSVDEVYVLRGGSFHVDVVSNYSSVNVAVFAPDNSLYASWTQNANTSRLVNVPMNAPYGTYAVRAVVEGNAAETWLSVLDVVGWSGVSFPYTRRHLNVDYTFFANGTVRAVQVNTGDVFVVDLSILRGLNGDWSAYANSMCFRARFTKASVVVDLTFAFVHTGCKFVVNGSLGQPREFTFEIANPQKLRRVIDGVKQGSIVFDWGDLRRAAHIFSYADGVLSLSLPTEFTFDPTIFSDGFESGDTSNWNEVSGTVTVETNNPHHGSYNAKFTGSAWLRKALTAQSDGYMRAYYKFPSSPPADKLISLMYFWTAEWETNAIVAINTYGSNQVALSLPSGIHSVTYTFFTDMWYCFVAEVKTGSGNGIGRLWINGDLVIESTTETINSGTVHFVLASSWEVPSEFVIYSDCVVVSDAYIGPETTNYTVPLSLASAMTYTMSKQWQAKNAIALATGESYLFNGASNCKLTPNWATSESYTVAGQWQANKALTLQTAESYTLSPQWNAENALSLETEEAFAFNSQAAYALLLPLNTAFSWLLGQGTNHNLALSLTQGATWLLNAQAGYHSALSWITGENFMLTTQAAYRLALPFTEGFQWLVDAEANYNLAFSLTQGFSWTVDLLHTLREGIAYIINLAWNTQHAWTLITQTAYKFATPLTEGLSWLFNAQTGYNLVLPVAQGFTWLLDFVYIPHVVVQIVDLVWSTPLSWTTQLQSAFNVAVSWVMGQTWTLDLIKGLGYIMDLAWQSGVNWLVDVLHAPLLAVDALAIAAFALIIGLAALGVAALVMFKRKEN